jgi:hypothetical protein
LFGDALRYDMLSNRILKGHSKWQLRSGYNDLYYGAALSLDHGCFKIHLSLFVAGSSQ